MGERPGTSQGGCSDEQDNQVTLHSRGPPEQTFTRAFLIFARKS
jgi:hypothetical protein